LGSEEVTRTPEGRRDFRQMMVIGVIASAVGVALALLIDWFPIQASKEGEQIDTLYDVLLIVSVPIFVLVEVVVLYCVWRFRMRPGQEEQDGPPIHGNTKLEIIWTAIPAILLVALCTYAYVVLDDIEDAKANSMNVRVVGEQFTWTFYYANPDGGGEEIASNELYVPIDQPILFQVQSKDVLHDFWVPAFRMKIDAVPGITTNIRVQPKREGTYPVVCAELCGLGHSVMRQTATVVPRQEFDLWLAEQAQRGAGGGAAEGEDGGAAAGGGEADGKTLFTTVQPACGSCHALADAGTSGGIGPDLEESLAGKDEAYIRRAIEEPDADVAEGFQPGIMPPNYGETLPPEEVDALVKYLADVTK
jgi:cytochrome c oxidase subunit II